MDDSGEQATMVGHFIISFSQLELMLKHALLIALGVKYEHRALMVANLGYSETCDLLLGVIPKEISDPDMLADAKQLIKDCKNVAETYRNPICHAVWAMDGQGSLSPEMLSRGSGKPKTIDLSSAKILEGTGEIARLYIKVGPLMCAFDPSLKIPTVNS